VVYFGYVVYFGMWYILACGIFWYVVYFGMWYILVCGIFWLAMWYILAGNVVYFGWHLFTAPNCAA
jgi:hypothetical protein